ncbi:RsmB/NOP family class I SAM-dependent RNA methyltransferase [Zhengella sp. ZM62]|uniref:RsmB/NOP family class I SAM-dependent RNA methyltransferase n=1 Tax=Zhengella sedimenti TaxID=3390035 RepID=UPI003974CD58
MVLTAKPRPKAAPKASRKPAPEAADRPGLAARRTAARLLGAIIDARSSMDGLTDNENGHPDYLKLEPRDRALVRAILMTALRHRRTIQAMIDKRLDRPLPANASLLSHILHVGAAQMLFLSVPDSAAVDLAVSHAQADPRSRRFANLVNAILRSIQRGGERARAAALHQTVDAPGWFMERLTDDYGAEKAAAIAAMHRQEAPVDFSVKSDPQGWAEKLGGIVMPTGSVRLARLEKPVPDLPGYAEGEWWVQDAAAALPARLMGPISGKRVADLCAAPGGKTAQLALAGARVTALDLSENRLRRLTANLARLGLEAETVATDLRAHDPGEPYDAVLLDAPCSSTGTVRRHPDVPWTKTPADIEKLAALQAGLLAHAVRLVRPGGTVVFSNCSLDHAEGERMIAAFLEGRGDLAIDPVRPGEIPGAEGFIAPQGWLRTTPADWPDAEPGLAGLDGFFAVRLTRLA